MYRHRCKVEFPVSVVIGRFPAVLPHSRKIPVDAICRELEVGPRFRALRHLLHQLLHSAEQLSFPGSCGNSGLKPGCRRSQSESTGTGVFTAMAAPVFCDVVGGCCCCCCCCCFCCSMSHNVYVFLFLMYVYVVNTTTAQQQ